METGGGQAQMAIPITVRQLEALVRVSESLAKMRLDTRVQGQDIAEALRLFRVSTMNANSADPSQAGGGGSDPAPGVSMSASLPSRDELVRAETFLRSRLAIGAVLNRQRVVEEAAAQGYGGMVVARALSIMVSRGEVQERNQSRMIKRRTDSSLVGAGACGWDIVASVHVNEGCEYGQACATWSTKLTERLGDFNWLIFQIPVVWRRLPYKCSRSDYNQIFAFAIPGTAWQQLSRASQPHLKSPEGRKHDQCWPLASGLVDMIIRITHRQWLYGNEKLHY
ncbi:hypothetical protein THAOC_32132, partial [Thalassiosira oceanica]